MPPKNATSSRPASAERARCKRRLLHGGHRFDCADRIRRAGERRPPYGYRRALQARMASRLRSAPLADLLEPLSEKQASQRGVGAVLPRGQQSAAFHRPVLLNHLP